MEQPKAPPGVTVTREPHRWCGSVDHGPLTGEHLAVSYGGRVVAYVILGCDEVRMYGGSHGTREFLRFLADLSEWAEGQGTPVSELLLAARTRVLPGTDCWGKPLETKQWASAQKVNG